MDHTNQFKSSDDIEAGARVVRKDILYAAQAVGAPIKIMNPIGYAGTAVADANGIATFYLTDDGTANGNSLFPTAVVKQTMRCWVDDSGVGPYFGGYDLSADRKVLKIQGKKPSKVTILTAIEVLIPTVTPAAGMTVNLVIRGY